VNRRRLLALGFAAALLASVAGTGGFASVDASRGIEVAVVDDDEAYLGIERGDASDGTWNVTLTNRLGTGEPLDVAVEVGEQTATASSIDSGESETVTLTGVACGDTANVIATAPDGSVTIEASREVSCSGPSGSSSSTATPTPA